MKSIHLIPSVSSESPQLSTMDLPKPSLVDTLKKRTRRVKSNHMSANTPIDQGHYSVLPTGSNRVDTVRPDEPLRKRARSNGDGMAQLSQAIMSSYPSLISAASSLSSGASLSAQNSTHGNIYECLVCGKQYKHPNCLSKHRWEHTDMWAVTSKLSLTKHQQVQLLEAASILISFTAKQSGSSSPVLSSNLGQPVLPGSTNYTDWYKGSFVREQSQTSTSFGGEESISMIMDDDELMASTPKSTSLPPALVDESSSSSSMSVTSSSSQTPLLEKQSIHEVSDHELPLHELHEHIATKMAVEHVSRPIALNSRRTRRKQQTPMAS